MLTTDGVLATLARSTEPCRRAVLPRRGQENTMTRKATMRRVMLIAPEASG
jgi:hypothetical protein